jgi:hypothetical protein
MMDLTEHLQEGWKGFGVIASSVGNYQGEFPQYHEEAAIRKIQMSFA